MDTVTKKNYKNKDENKRTLFIGNLPFDADEEDLRSFFETQIKKHKSNLVEDGENVVESVKIVRSKDTRVGKGFAYVILKVLYELYCDIVCCVYFASTASEW